MNWNHSWEKEPRKKVRGLYRARRQSPDKGWGLGGLVLALIFPHGYLAIAKVEVQGPRERLASSL